MLVELKNGETLNGHLVSCDTWMNLTLKEVVQTSPVRFPPLVVSCAWVGDSWISDAPVLIYVMGQEGDKFFRLPEVYVKGNNVRFP